MLEGKELEKAIAQIMKRLRIVNITYIKKIAAQIKKIGELNPSSVNRLVAMSDMNADIAEIRGLLRVTAAVNAKELRQVFTKAVTETKNDPRFAKYLAKYPLKDTAKQRVERFVQSLYRQTAANMYNYSNTTAITQGYSEAIDKAVLASATGVSSYTETMRDTIREIGHAGLQVQYESGYHRRLDTAVRQNIVDAVNQINKNAGLMIGEELGYDAVEISAHARSAPDHEPVQGHVFMLEEYEKMQSGLMFRDIDGKVYEGFRRPIGEWNCGHTPMSFSTKYSSRKWTAEQLQAFIDENQTGCAIEGKHRTLYEASQMMRNIETQVRREKDTAIAAKEAGDEELRQECQRNINSLVKRYAQIAKASGNAEKRQRMTVEGFRAVKVPSTTDKMSAVSPVKLNAPPIKHTPAELDELGKYAESRGIRYYNPREFDGDISLMKRQIDAIDKMCKQFKLSQRITIRTSAMPDGVLGETNRTGRTMTLNAAAFRSEAVTNRYLNADTQLAATKTEGIGVHEIGHVIAKRYGEIGLDIAVKACYNVLGKQLTPVQTLEYLSRSVSTYSAQRREEDDGKPIGLSRFREIIPEVLSKHATNSDAYTTEFVKLLKEAYEL